jgi:hypothetical protein
MYTGRITSQLSIGGVSMTGTIVRTAETIVPTQTTLPAGVAGAISATGVDGLATDHGFEALDVVDVHWVDPSDGSAKCRRGVTLDGASANAVTFDNDPAAEGDALPIEGTAVVVSARVTVEGVAFDGDALKILAIKSTRNAIVDLRTSAASAYAPKLAAEEAAWWAAEYSGTNPIEGDTIETIVASNASTSAATLSVIALLDTVA